MRANVSATLVLGLLVLMVGAGAADAQLQMAWMDPATVTTGTVGWNGDVTIRVQGIIDLWGVDYWITFDPALFSLTAPITAGVCPAPDLPLANTVDNGTGVGHYAVSAFGSGPCDCASTPDQVAAVLNFTRIALGVSAFDFSLVNPPGVSVMANNSVEVCNASTPGCWFGAVTDIPVELTAISVD